MDSQKKDLEIDYITVDDNKINNLDIEDIKGKEKITLNIVVKEVK